MNWLKNEWKECSVFFKEQVKKETILVTIAFFIVGAISWIILAMNTDLLLSAYNWLMQIFESKGIDAENITALDLFKNNTMACLYAILMGYIPFFFVDAFSLITNGASIGIMGAVYSYSNLSMSLLMAGLLPHGIFELPAIFISLALGFKTCLLMTKRITGKINQLNMKEHTLNLVRVFVFIVIPLLILAALIEAHITPIVMQWFM